MKRVFYIIMCLVSFFPVAQNNVLFDDATALYNEAKYSDAISKYEAIIDNGKHSAELYFNLANAHYKLNHIAPSIFYYEKALQLNPTDNDIKNNIAFARNMTIDAINSIPEVGFSKIVKDITNIFDFETWALLSIAFMLSFVLLFISYYFSRNTSRKRMSFIFSFICLFLVVCTLAFAFNKYGIIKSDKPAIVFAQESKVKSEPNLRSSEAFKLHEGTKVQVLDTVNNWKKIKLSDGKTGWIASSDIKLLNNF